MVDYIGIETQQLFLAHLKWQKLFKRCLSQLKLEWLCMFSAPVVLRNGLKDQPRQAQDNKK